ncbi:MAG: DUF3597 domain-containing protein [Acetobacteraceae bacterium]|nr:DUF3597 domain-containing protein [Acetobacteraceae bacterium]
MSIFGSIVSKIFGHRGAAAATDAVPPGSAAPDASPGEEAAGQPGAGATAPPRPEAAPQTTAPQNVDVAAVLTDMAAKNPQKLDWRHSIVDLMKLLGLDSGLQARRDLAQELGYTGDTGDSAAMNIWLHKQVMAKLAQNGGKVPDELRS